jgi:LysR family transcriptional regulator for bpeEF and oprC
MRDLNALAIFVAVVRLDSFALAADHCGVSRAQVSKQVHALEAALGVRLLHRTTRRLGLTQAGEKFYARCLRLLEDAEDAFLDMENAAGALHGVIRISAGMAFGRLHLLPAVADFLALNPGVKIDVSLSEQFADLVAGGTDLVVRMADTPRLGSLVARKLALVEFVLAAAPAYLSRVPAPAVPADLGHCNCIRYGGEADGVWTLEGEAGVEKVHVAGSLRANNADGILQGVLAGTGIGILPTFVAAPWLARGELVRVLPGHRLPGRTLYAMFLPERRLPARVTQFVRFLGDRFSSAVYWDGWARGG